MLTVHHLENSRSQRILWLLEELGVDHEITQFSRDLMTACQAGIEKGGPYALMGGK